MGTCQLLTIPEVAERLRVCRATVYRLVAEGRIPAMRISSGASAIAAELALRGGRLAELPRAGLRVA